MMKLVWVLVLCLIVNVESHEIHVCCKKDKQEPYNYMLDIPDPSAKVMEGLKTGAYLRGLRKQRAAAKVAAEKQAALDRAIAALGPKSTAAEYAEVARMLPPDQQEAFLKTWSFQNQEQNALEKQAAAMNRGLAALGPESVVFTGIPKIRISEDGTSRTPKHLAKNDAMEYQCIITRIDDRYYWTTKENVELIPTVSGAFITYLAINGSGYVRFLNPEFKYMVPNMSETEQAFDYVEHSLSGLGTISYYGLELH